MDTDKELRSGGAGPRREPSLVNAEPQHGTGAGLSASLSRSSTSAPSSQGACYHTRPHVLQQRTCDNRDHRAHTVKNRDQPHSRSLIMPDTWTQPTFSGPSSLPEAHASGLNTTGASPMGPTKPSHRNPYQHPRSHPNLGPSNPPRSSSDDRFQKPGGGPSFSPPFLHPLSLRANPKSSRTPSPHLASAQRYRDSRKPRTRFTIGSSRPNSPLEEPETKRESSPTRPAPPLTARGFLALPTLSRVVVILFACCVFVLFRAFLGIGHSAEGCRVYAHEMSDLGPKPGSSPGSSGAGLDLDDPGFPTKDGMLVDQKDEDEEARMRPERVEEMYGYQYGWKFGEYEIGHDDDDRYDDEYEQDVFLDPA